MHSLALSPIGLSLYAFPVKNRKFITQSHPINIRRFKWWKIKHPGLGLASSSGVYQNSALEGQVKRMDRHLQIILSSPYIVTDNKHCMWKKNEQFFLLLKWNE